MCLFYYFWPKILLKSLISAQKMTLMERRQTLCQKFSVKNSQNGIFTKWFNPKNKVCNTRSKAKYMDVPARCERWRQSPIPKMTKYLNDNA